MCVRWLWELKVKTLWVRFFFKQKTAYEMRISDWSSDVCSSDLEAEQGRRGVRVELHADAVVGEIEAAEGGDQAVGGDRKSVVEGKSVSVRVDLGGRRIIKKNRQSQVSIRTTTCETHFD